MSFPSTPDCDNARTARNFHDILSISAVDNTGRVNIPIIGFNYFFTSTFDASFFFCNHNKLNFAVFLTYTLFSTPKITILHHNKTSGFLLDLLKQVFEISVRNKQFKEENKAQISKMQL